MGNSFAIGIVLAISLKRRPIGMIVGVIVGLAVGSLAGPLIGIYELIMAIASGRDDT